MPAWGRPLLSLAGFLMIWQALVMTGRVPQEYLPGVPVIFKALAAQAGAAEFWAGEALTLARAVGGLLLATVTGVGLALAGARHRVIERALSPLVQLLPAALPQIMSGVRLGLAVALLVSVSSEMLLSTDGMGNYLMRAQEQFQISGGLAGILTIALVSLATNAAVLRIERRLLSWHHARHGMGQA